METIPDQIQLNDYEKQKGWALRRRSVQPYAGAPATTMVDLYNADNFGEGIGYYHATFNDDPADFIAIHHIAKAFFADGPSEVKDV